MIVEGDDEREGGVGGLQIRRGLVEGMEVTEVGDGAETFVLAEGQHLSPLLSIQCGTGSEQICITL